MGKENRCDVRGKVTLPSSVISKARGRNDLGRWHGPDANSEVDPRADAQGMPLISEFADLVVVNANIHHCDDMALALSEAARLVAPGGQLVIDHEPQLYAWDFRGPGLALWRSRLAIYRLIRKGFHRSTDEQRVALASEIHHDAGDGVTKQLFESMLIPRGFSAETFPYNHDVGSEILDGEIGRSSFQLRIGQRLSGIDPNSSVAALSLMCTAVRAGATVAG